MKLAMPIPAKVLSKREYRSFVLLYHARDPHKPLIDPAKVERKLGVHLNRVWTIRSSSLGMDCVALVSTTKRFTLDGLCRCISADAYNAADPEGLQMVGDLRVLCKAHADEYEQHMRTVQKVVFNPHGNAHGVLLGDWTLSDYRVSVNSEIIQAMLLLSNEPAPRPVKQKTKSRRPKHHYYLRHRATLKKGNKHHHYHLRNRRRAA